MFFSITLIFAKGAKNDIKFEVVFEGLKICFIRSHLKGRVCMMLLKSSCRVDNLSNIDLWCGYTNDYIDMVSMVICY
jgi:hypothetical protein